MYEEIIRPALERVGELWETDRITVADEHIATATASAAVAALYPEFPWPPGRGSRAIVACAQGERHELGARFVADLLALDGWDELFLGADVPVSALTSKIVEVNPRVVALSVTLAVNLRGAAEVIRQVRTVSVLVKVILGGRAVKLHSQAALDCRADAVAHSAVEAVELIRAWR